MYILIAGGGKVGSNLTRTLLRDGHEVTLIEQRSTRYDQLEIEFEHQVLKGDATEMFVLESAGIRRPPDLVVAVTGDDEDNVVICQLAREKYGVETVIARVNDPRNQIYFDLLGITRTVSATSSIMALIEHEVPQHGLIHLLELRKENLEIVEVTEVLDEPAAVAAVVTEVVISPDHAQHLRLLEALIFAGDKALDEKDLVDRLPNDANIPQLLADLAEMYAGRGVNLVKVAGGWAFRTAPDLAEKLKIEKPVTRKLSRASVETLAIIAYHQPVTRAEIEQVRGVGLSKGTLDLLFEQNWIKPMGRRRAPGKPVTWGTTDFFLEHFGLGSLDDLPGQEELKAAGLLDPRSQPPIFRPEEPDLPLEPTEDEDEPLAADDTAPGSTPKAD